jgi:hypothetical protein
MGGVELRETKLIHGHTGRVRGCGCRHGVRRRHRHVVEDAIKAIQFGVGKERQLCEDGASRKPHSSAQALGRAARVCGGEVAGHGWLTCIELGFVNVVHAVAPGQNLLHFLLIFHEVLQLVLDILRVVWQR